MSRYLNRDEDYLIASYQDRLLIDASEAFYGEGRWADPEGGDWDEDDFEGDGCGETE